MPQAPKQHSLASVGAKHSVARRHRPKERRGSARERGYTTRWDKFSKAFLAANPLCEFCLAQGRITPATVTDHDVPHKGDMHLFWNNTFTALCTRHHSVTKQSLEARYTGEALEAAIRRHKGGE